MNNMRMMKMKYIEDINLTNKKVILRLDLNVTIKNGEIIDDTKIKKSIPTIKYILNQNSRVLIMSHLGKIKTADDMIKNTLKPVKERLEDLLGEQVLFVPGTRGADLESALEKSRIVLMENTRYEDLNGKLESSCDMELSRYWASLGDVFINDAFGTTHRKHASNYGISSYIDSAYGFLINEEIEGLDPILNNIKRPFSVIMGGAKVDDKVQLIESLLDECDYLLVGGGIANTFLKATGYNIGKSLYSSDYVDRIKELIEKHKSKIILPIDVVVKGADGIRTCSIDEIKDEDAIYDIGPNSVSSCGNILRMSETIFVNGTMGLYEEELFRNGTEKLYKVLSNLSAVKIAGGGDAVASVNKLGFNNSFDFLSTGGGATLEYIASKKISCFEDR